MQTTSWRRRPPLVVAVASVLVGLAALSACSQEQSTPAAADLPSSPMGTTVSPTVATSAAGAITTTLPASTTRAPTTTAAKVAGKASTRRPVTSRAKPASPTRAVARVAAAPPSCAVGSGVSASRVVLVQSSGVRATVSACRRSGGRYVRELGPYSGWVGRSGTVAASAKREGDGHTPRGVFALRGGFGTAANPGLGMGWFHAGADDVWVDDPGSALYNSHQRKPVAGRWRSAEDLAIPAYRYAQVIGWNEARTPGRGSAIFLHVSTGGATAGCVSLPSASLRAVMQWERPGTVIVIR